MKLIAGHDEVICRWLAEKFATHVVQTPRQILGIIDDAGVLRGAFVITWHHDTTAELSVYGTLTQDTVKGMFQAVFLGWGVHRLEVRTSKRNKRVKRSTPKYGFKFECVARDYYGPGEDAVVYAMTPDQCRWLRHGLNVQVSEGAETY